MGRWPVPLLWRGGSFRPTSGVFAVLYKGCLENGRLSLRQVCVQFGSYSLAFGVRTSDGHDGRAAESFPADTAHRRRGPGVVPFLSD